MYAYVCIYTYMCIHKYVYTFVYIRLCIYIYTHTYTYMEKEMMYFVCVCSLVSFSTPFSQKTLATLTIFAWEDPAGWTPLHEA